MSHSNAQPPKQTTSKGANVITHLALSPGQSNTKWKGSDLENKEMPCGGMGGGQILTASTSEW